MRRLHCFVFAVVRLGLCDLPGLPSHFITTDRDKSDLLADFFSNSKSRSPPPAPRTFTYIPLERPETGYSAQTARSRAPSTTANSVYSSQQDPGWPSDSHNSSRVSFNSRSGRPMAGLMDVDRTRTRRDRTFVGTECAICDEPLEHTLRGERVLQFSCTHVSHEACFYEYIREFEGQYCPTCDAPLGLDTSRGGNMLDLGRSSLPCRDRNNGYADHYRIQRSSAILSAL